MSKISCEKCGKEFNSKSHYTQHQKRKTPCVNESKIKELIDKSVEEKLIKLNKSCFFITLFLLKHSESSFTFLAFCHKCLSYISNIFELRKNIISFCCFVYLNISWTFLYDKYPK